MPQKKSTDTLKSMCLMNIVTNANFWFQEENVDESTVINGDGFIDCLPHTLMLDLLSLLHKKMLLKRHQLPLLLHANLERLDLSENFCGRLDSNFYDHLTDLISSRCHKLKYLNLALCNTIRCTALVQLVKTLPNIKVLNLSSTTASDAVLFALGAYCRRLQVLDVSDNNVTDVGISALCFDLEHKNYSSGCLQLCSLYIEATSVTETGVLCALVNLPRLKIFQHDHTCAGLPLYLRNYKHHVVKTNKFLLQNLTINFWQSTSEHLHQEMLEFFVDTCPNITELKLYFREPFEPVPMLTHFRFLQELTIHGSEHLTFDGFIANVLELVGAQLKALTLFCTPKFTVIGQCCPHLQCLYVCKPLGAARIILAEEVSMAVMPFQHLENLCIQDVNCHSGISCSQLVYVLSHSRKLKLIDLQGCDELTDRCVKTVLDYNLLPCLENLYLHFCCNITTNSIMNLISLDNPMSSIILNSCSLITSSDFQSMKNRVKDENLDLDITWA